MIDDPRACSGPGKGRGSIPSLARFHCLELEPVRRSTLVRALAGQPHRSCKEVDTRPDLHVISMSSSTFNWLSPPVSRRRRSEGPLETERRSSQIVTPNKLVEKATAEARHPAMTWSLI